MLRLNDLLDFNAIHSANIVFLSGFFLHRVPFLHPEVQRQANHNANSKAANRGDPGKQAVSNDCGPRSCGLPG